MNAPGHYRRLASIAWIEVEGEAVLVDERTGEIHRLDRWGTMVWRALDGRVALSQLAGDLATRGAADQERVADDLAEFLEALMVARLVEWTA